MTPTKPTSPLRLTEEEKAAFMREHSGLSDLAIRRIESAVLDKAANWLDDNDEETASYRILAAAEGEPE